MTERDVTDMLGPIKRKKTAEQVLERLSELIKAGVWQNGERLPSEKELCEMLGVGRSSIREAVRSLEFMGLVDVRYGGGTLVAQDTSAAMGRAIARAVTLAKQDVLDLIEARELIESHLASLAALRIDSEGLAELRCNWEKMVRSLDHPGPFIEADLNFHICLAKAAQSRVLFRILLTIRGLLEQLIGQALKAPGTPQAAADQHARILEAVERRDSEGAKAAMNAHLEDIKGRLMGG